MTLGSERWHSVAFDEAHEMCINKDLKAAVVRQNIQELNQTMVSRKVFPFCQA